MKKIVYKEQGFTLLEILVSLTILAIIIIAFVPIFTQAAIHNKVNGSKLKTNEAAQVVASEYQELSALNLGETTTSLPTCPQTERVSLDESKVIGDSSYKVTVKLCNFKTGDVDSLIQAIFTTESIGQKPSSEGVARKFLTEENNNVQNP